MSISPAGPAPQPAAPKTWPASRIGTDLTAEESLHLWTLDLLHPKADIIGDPETWPEFTDCDCWSIPTAADSLAARRRYAEQTVLAYQSPWPEGV